MGRCPGHANVPAGEFLSIGVSIDDRHAKSVFSPPLPPGEGVGGRGLRGWGWFAPGCFGFLRVSVSLCELTLTLVFDFRFCFWLTAGCGPGGEVCVGRRG